MTRNPSTGAWLIVAGVAGYLIWKYWGQITSALPSSVTNLLPASILPATTTLAPTTTQQAAAASTGAGTTVASTQPVNPGGPMVSAAPQVVGPIISTIPTQPLPTVTTESSYVPFTGPPVQQGFNWASFVPTGIQPPGSGPVLSSYDYAVMCAQGRNLPQCCPGGPVNWTPRGCITPGVSGLGRYRRIA